MCVPFFHKWKVISSVVTQIYDSYRDEFPISKNTKILYVCEKCGTHKSKKFNGAFKL